MVCGVGDTSRSLFSSLWGSLRNLPVVQLIFSHRRSPHSTHSTLFPASTSAENKIVTKRDDDERSSCRTGRSSKPTAGSTRVLRRTPSGAQSPKLVKGYGGHPLPQQPQNMAPESSNGWNFHRLHLALKYHQPFLNQYILCLVLISIEQYSPILLIIRISIEYKLVVYLPM